MPPADLSEMDVGVTVAGKSGDMSRGANQEAGWGEAPTNRATASEYYGMCEQLRWVSRRTDGLMFILFLVFECFVSLDKPLNYSFCLLLLFFASEDWVQQL